MGQKTHPLGFRLGITQEHKSKWFAGNNDYANSILEDQFLRNFLDQTYKDAGIIEINIERKLDQIQISIRAARPGIFLGQDSGSLDKLRYRLEQKLTSFRNRSLNRSAYPNSNRNTQKPSIALNINEIEKVYLIASGGPLLNKKIKYNEKLKNVLKHPNWKMGKKITIDSSNLANKIFELFEAKILFNIPGKKLEY